MSEPCVQSERVSVIEYRLKSGDTILQILTDEIKNMGVKVSEMYHCMMGDKGLLKVQEKHNELFTLIVNKETVSKVEAHDKVFSGVHFVLKVIGVASLFNIIAFLIVVYQLIQIMK